jgi:hypothetical protein
VKLTCEHEGDLLDALAARRWPDRADAALRDHVSSCTVCADVAVVAAAFFADGDSEPAAPLPPASVVWWKAQIRARQDAARLASRPILLVQAVATMCAAAAALALAPSAAAWVRGIVAGMGATGWWSVPHDVSLGWLLGVAAYVSLPILAVGVWIVLAPVLVYLALDE